MKVGILSMQEVKNYGSFLQAFSLKNNIETLGHKCEFVNIVPGKQLNCYKFNKFHKISLLAKRLYGWDFINRFKYIYEFQSRFSKEFLPKLGVKKKLTLEHFDTIVIGSDEVFNCTQKTWFGFSRQLFGEGLNADKVITYAASFGATTIDKLDKLGIKKIVAELLKKLNKISVRDDNSMQVLKTLTGIVPNQNIDPVLIFDFDKFMPKSVDINNYMIVYTYPGRITNKNEISAIRDYAKKHRLKLVSIGHYFSWCDITIVPTPFEVLTYFKYATCIVTDTFHGSVFSIKYNKRFCTIVRDMNSNKVTFLLEQFKLSNRIVNDTSKMAYILDKQIDYVEINKKIKFETERSLTYLSDNL
jgi:hypothetical protein